MIDRFVANYAIKPGREAYLSSRILVQVDEKFSPDVLRHILHIFTVVEKVERGVFDVVVKAFVESAKCVGVALGGTTISWISPSVIFVFGGRTV